MCVNNLPVIIIIIIYIASYAELQRCCDCYLAVDQLGVEPATSQSLVPCVTIRPPSHGLYVKVKGTMPQLGRRRGAHLPLTAVEPVGG